jgi:hypothetical protein
MKDTIIKYAKKIIGDKHCIKRLIAGIAIGYIIASL